MNICLYTPTFLPKQGGVEITVDALARQFQGAGHSVTVLAKTPHDGAHAVGLPYPAVYYRRSWSAVYALGPYRRALRRQHALNRFDIIHAHMAYPNGYLAARLRTAMDAPVVITVHGGDVGPVARYLDRPITRRRTIWALTHADAITAVSINLANRVEELTDATAVALHIPGGVDADHLPPPSPPPRLAHLAALPFVLTLGRLHQVKGLDLLLEAMARLSADGRPIPPLVIAGDGPEREALTRQAARLHLDQNTSFVGTVLGDEKLWLLNACRLFIQPSRFEGLGLTVLEAMARGKTVIAAAVGGILDIIDHDRNGILVDPESPAQLAQAIARLWDDPVTVARISGPARATSAKYAWSAIAQQYLGLFQSLLAAQAATKTRRNI